MTIENLPLSDEEGQTFERLRRRLSVARPLLRQLNDYYEGDERLRQLGLAIPPELQNFQVILNWPRVTVDGCEQRLDVVGFRLPGQAADDYLWELWQSNDLDEQQSFAHTDALALGRSYLCIGTNPDDAEHPIVTVESPLEMVTLRDARTRRVTAALRLYGEELDAENRQQTDATIVEGTRATLYLPQVTYWLRRDQGSWQLDGDPDDHRLGVVPVVPVVNRDRATRRTTAIIEGVSEMSDVIPIAESASRAVTNAQVAQETHAVPHRVLIGATKADFVRPDGTPTGAFETYMSALTALSSPNAKAQQLDASDMSNFETMVNLYARAAAGVTGMPIEYFGLNTQNAPSAEGQRAGETRLIKKAERKQVAFGHAWEQAMRIVLRFRGQEDTVEQRGLEAIWRDAGTPTKAQVTDSVAKLFAADLIDWETAQEDLGRSPAQIELMKARRQADLGVASGMGVQLALVADANTGPEPAGALPAAPATQQGAAGAA